MPKLHEKLTPDQFAQIFARIEAGATLRKILPEFDLPRSTFIGWIAEDQTLADRYAHAMQERADAWAEGIVEIGTDPNLAADHRRVSVEALKWAAGKAAPKKYGEHLELGGEVTIRRKDVIDKAVAAAAAADD